MKKSIKIICLALLVASTACSQELSHHGFNIEQVDLSEIKIGTSTEADVINALGTPTSKSNFGDYTLYYIHSVTAKKAFFEEKLIEQSVVAFKFDKDKKLINISQLTTDDSNNIISSKDYTQIKGNSMNPIQQIMGNIGKYNKNTNAKRF